MPEISEISYAYDLQHPHIVLPNITAVTKFADVPSNAATQSTRECNGWWEVQSGDTYDAILQAIDTSFEAFYTWNPSIGADCSNLWLKTSYCVYGLGFDDACYKCSSVSPTTTNPTATTTSKAANSPPAPTQAGIASNCDGWYVAVAGDQCEKIALTAHITLPDFYRWNPAVGTSCSGLWVGYAYCIRTSGTITSAPPPATTTSAGAPAPPGPTQAGIVKGCKKWMLQKSGVYCYDMAVAAGITPQQLYAWNPALNGDCSGMWAGYAYCVGT